MRLQCLVRFPADLSGILSKHKLCIVVLWGWLTAGTSASGKHHIMSSRQLELRPGVACTAHRCPYTHIYTIGKYAQNKSNILQIRPPPSASLRMAVVLAPLLQRLEWLQLHPGTGARPEAPAAPWPPPEELRRSRPNQAGRPG